MIATHSKVNKSWKVNREVKQGQCKKYGTFLWSSNKFCETVDGLKDTIMYQIL